MTDTIVVGDEARAKAKDAFREKFMQALTLYESYNKRTGDGSSSEMMAHQALQNAGLQGTSLAYHFLFFCGAKNDEKREAALTEAWEQYCKTTK
jgi:phosphopantetheinyl transferase